MTEDKPFLETLQIETVSLCNAKCDFCPHKSMKRKGGFMSDDLFKKIIDDAVSHKPLVVYPMLNGEPFLDPKFINRLAYLKKQLPESIIGIYSNGNLLTDQLSDSLVSILTERDYLNVSINGVTDEERMALMGVPFQPMMHQLNYLLRHPKRTFQIQFSMIMDKKYHSNVPPNILEHVSKSYPNCAFAPFPNGNWAGKTFPLFYNDGFGCGRVYNSLYILHDGRVCLCCYDLEGEVILGDLNTQSISEVLNCEKFKQIRSLHSTKRRNECELCKDCTTG